jgi:hypothetical protein
LPLGLVAIEKGPAAGTLAIAEPATLSHPQLTPWIVGFWVETARRKSGIGTIAEARQHLGMDGGVRMSPCRDRDGFAALPSRRLAQDRYRHSKGGAKVELFAMKLS